MSTKAVSDITDAEYASFGKAVAAMLGASLEWSGADMLEDIDGKAESRLGVSVGDQTSETLAQWRKLADDENVYYEEDEDEDDHTEMSWAAG